MDTSARLDTDTWHDVAEAAAEDLLRTRGMSQEEFKAVMDGQRRWREAERGETARAGSEPALPQHEEKQGWLFKRGRYTRSWSARYFAFAGSRLVYFLHAQHFGEYARGEVAGSSLAASSRGSFPLSAGCTCGPLVEKGTSNRPLFSFRLVGPDGGHAMLLASASAAEAGAWRALLHRAIERLATTSQ